MPFAFSCWISLEKIGSNTASVFPLPVGAIRRTFLPASIGRKAIVCGFVGIKNPSSCNILRIGLASSLKTELWFSICIVTKNRLSRLISLSEITFQSGFVELFQFLPNVNVIMSETMFSCFIKPNAPFLADNSSNFVTLSASMSGD